MRAMRPAASSVLASVMLAAVAFAVVGGHATRAADAQVAHDTKDANEAPEGDGDARPATRLVTIHPALESAPRRTATKHGRAGDPVNIALVGSDRELHHALSKAGWYAADPITLKTSLRIAADVVVKKPYPHAPVSDLYLWGRRQDLAFERPVGDSPKQRHHVRFWRSEVVDASGEPLWLGAATFDERVEVSRVAGITHRIAAAIDREREKIILDTFHAGTIHGYYWIDGFHRQKRGTNGGGDPYHTDGRLAVGVLTLTR